MYGVPSLYSRYIILGIQYILYYTIGTYFHIVSVLGGHPFKLTYFRLLACPVPGIVTQDDTLYLVTSRSKRFLNYLFCSTNTESKLNREWEIEEKIFKKKTPWGASISTTIIYLSFQDKRTWNTKNRRTFFTRNKEEDHCELTTRKGNISDTTISKPIGKSK